MYELNTFTHIQTLIVNQGCTIALQVNQDYIFAMSSVNLSIRVNSQTNPKEILNINLFEMTGGKAVVERLTEVRKEKEEGEGMKTQRGLEEFELHA